MGKYNAAIVAVLLFLPSWGKTQDLLPKLNSSDTLIRHTYYITSYSSWYKQARWNYHIITSSRTYGKYERGNKDFVIDPSLTERHSCKNESYVGSGFDKGHLAAAEDMTHALKAINESFYLINASPQLASFNRGIWRKLENKVRKWGTETFDTIYVISGGILHKKLRRLNKDVTIPDNFYKIVITGNSTKGYKGIAFLMPHKPSKEPLENFVVTIDRIEELTKIDFCYKLPNQVEEDLESKVDLEFWEW